jgi:hypothetical protein
VCGQVVCALPPKPSVRERKCSYLFVANLAKGLIHEVEEQVDYGVSRRVDAGKVVEDRHKGVRICHDCRYILQRKRFQLESSVETEFVKIYQVVELHADPMRWLTGHLQAFISIEEEIKETLPELEQRFLAADFKEGDAQLEKKKKDMFDMFALYQALAQRLRNYPYTQSHDDPSQTKIQKAMSIRANTFLQQRLLSFKVSCEY